MPHWSIAINLALILNRNDATHTKVSAICSALSSGSARDY